MLFTEVESMLRQHLKKSLILSNIVCEAFFPYSAQNTTVRTNCKHQPKQIWLNGLLFKKKKTCLQFSTIQTSKRTLQKHFWDLHPSHVLPMTSIYFVPSGPPWKATWTPRTMCPTWSSPLPITTSILSSGEWPSECSIATSLKSGVWIALVWFVWRDASKYSNFIDINEILHWGLLLTACL